MPVAGSGGTRGEGNAPAARTDNKEGELGPDRHQVLIALRGRPVGRTRLRRFSAASTNHRRGGDTAPSYDSSVRRRTPRVHRDRRGTRTVVEGRASIVWWCHTSSACGLRPGHLSASSVASARLGGVGQPADREVGGQWRLDVCARQIAYLQPRII